MATPLSDLVVKVRAQTAEFTSGLNNAAGETRKFAAVWHREASGLRGAIESNRGALREFTMLTGGLSEAFGGVGGQAMTAARHIAVGFGTFGIAGLAVGAVTALVNVLIERHIKAGEAAAKAAEKAAEAERKHAEAIDTSIKKLEDFISASKRARDVAFAGEVNVTAQEGLGALDKRIEEAKAARDARQGSPAIGIAGVEERIADVKALNDKIVALEAQRHQMAVGANREFLAKLEQETKEADAYRAEESFRIFKDAEARKEKAATDRVRRLQAFETSAQKYTADLDKLRELTAQTEGDKALVQLQKELDQIDALTIASEEDKNAARLAAQQRYYERTQQIEAQIVANQKQANRGIGRDAKAAAEDAQREAANIQSAVMGLGGAIADFVVAPLTQGFKSMADFAKSVQKLLLSLIAELIKAVVLAALISILLPGGGAAATGLTAVIGKGLGFKGFATGGATGSDTLYRFGSNEYVQPPNAVAKWGQGFMDSIAAGVIPASATAGGGGGAGGTSVTYVVQALDVPGAQQAAQRLDIASRRRINDRSGDLINVMLQRALRNS